jgi:hypothetical protein
MLTVTTNFLALFVSSFQGGKVGEAAAAVEGRVDQADLVQFLREKRYSSPSYASCGTKTNLS